MVGETISHYRIVGKLGIGGMGVVYAAEDHSLGRRVALKLLPEELKNDPAASNRLKREAQVIALLNHPNICTVYEFGEDRGRAFIAMERLEGASLKSLVGSALETKAILNIAIQVTLALEAAHTRGVIHRDIKPGNIFVGVDAHVKVLDFGLARPVLPLTDPDLSRLEGSTVLGRPMGTANYMAPERILQMPLDGRCDLFSLGVVMYELMTGQQPFAGDSPGETVTNVLEHDPIPSAELSPARPARLHEVVSTLLAKRAGNRYQSAAAVRAELERLGARLKTPVVKRLLRRSKR